MCFDFLIAILPLVANPGSWPGLVAASDWSASPAAFVQSSDLQGDENLNHPLPSLLAVSSLFPSATPPVFNSSFSVELFPSPIPLRSVEVAGALPHPSKEKKKATPRGRHPRIGLQLQRIPHTVPGNRIISPESSEIHRKKLRKTAQGTHRASRSSNPLAPADNCILLPLASSI